MASHNDEQTYRTMLKIRACMYLISDASGLAFFIYPCSSGYTQFFLRSSAIRNLPLVSADLVQLRP